MIDIEIIEIYQEYLNKKEFPVLVCGMLFECGDVFREMSPTEFEFRALNWWENGGKVRASQPDCE